MRLSLKNSKFFHKSFSKSILLCITIHTFSCINAQWLDISSNRNDITFAGNLGFIVGDNGLILKSVDFGKNWQNVPNPLSKFYHGEYVRVSADGKNIKVLANRFMGQSQVGPVYAPSCVIIESNDEGKSWRVIFAKDGRGSGFFLNDKVGWVISNNIDQGIWNSFKTVNGGISWVEDKTFPRVYAMDFYDESNGWAIVNFSNTGNEVGIAKTGDGGKNWTRSFGLNLTFHAFNFLIVTDQNNAVYWDSSHSGRIIKTADAGATWSRANFDYSGSGVSIQMLDSKRGFIFSESNGWFKTSDGFNTVEKQQLPDAKKVWLTDDENSLLIGRNGLLAASEDGNTTWQVLSNWQGELISPNYNLETYSTETDIFIRDSEAWIVGYGLASKADLNATIWSDKIGQKGEKGKIDIRSIYSREVSDVKFYAEKGCMVGNGIGIRITNDNGETWEDDNGKMPQINNGGSPFYEDLYVQRKIYYQDKNTIWIVGNAEYILKSVDSGKTFRVVLDCSTKNAVCGTKVRLAFLKNAVIAYYINSNYKTLVSYDNGISWNRTEEEIALMSFLNEDVGWKLLWNNDLYKTSDGGITWKFIRKMNFSFFLSTRQIKMSFVDEKAGWLVSNNQFFFTRDEGKSWQMEEKGVSYNIEQMKFHFASSGDVIGLASGEGILRYVGGYKPYKKQNQSVSFNPVSSKKYNDPRFELSAQSTSGLPIVYSSSNTSVATVSQNIVTITGVGTTTLSATQKGNIDFNPATEVQLFTVVKADQSISFSAINNKTVDSPPFHLIASANSGLPVRFTSTSDKISLINNEVTLIDAGRSSIIAIQEGNNNYNPAPSKVQSFCINPRKPLITIKGATATSSTLLSSSREGNQWFINGVRIPDGTNQELSASLNGLYSVQVKKDDCVSEFSDGQILVITGDIQSNVQPLEVFPNPVSSSGLLNIRLGSHQIRMKIQIYCVDGQLMDSREVYGRDTQFNVTNYPSGLYLLKVTAPDSVSVVRFLKQ